MKLVIKDNKVIATHDNEQAVENLYDDCKFVIDNDWNGLLGDEYIITSEQENATKKTELQAELNELDIKRIRAVCEMAIKDEATGQTWLEFYNEQAQELRTQIAGL